MCTCMWVYARSYPFTWSLFIVIYLVTFGIARTVLLFVPYSTLPISCLHKKFSTLSAKALSYSSRSERQIVSQPASQGSDAISAPFPQLPYHSSQSVGRPSFHVRSQICALSRDKRFSCLRFIVFAILLHHTIYQYTWLLLATYM